jgi:hypothetical protein
VLLLPLFVVPGKKGMVSREGAKAQRKGFRVFPSRLRAFA